MCKEKEEKTIKKHLHIGGKHACGKYESDGTTYPNEVTCKACLKTRCFRDYRIGWERGLKHALFLMTHEDWKKIIRLREKIEQQDQS